MATNGKMTNGGSHSAKKKPAHEKYAIGSAILEPAIHHESFEKLWETKWKAPVSYCLSPALPTSDAYQDFQVYNGGLPVHVWFHQGL